MGESPAPWGELATDNVILTLPTADLRALADPEPLLCLWDDMMRAIARLAARPFPFCRPERIVADVQLSAGGCSRACSQAVDTIDLLFYLFLSAVCVRHNFTRKGKKT